MISLIKSEVKKGFHMRHADAASGMRQQMDTVGTLRNDSICTDADTVSGEDTGASN